MATFKIGLSMAGAVSAGAYTAGVLDFLVEALDEWHKARERGDAVPLHNVSIEVISGASAGGMCAAISAVLLREDFKHIHDTSERGTSNRLYESWVNRIDIRELLKTEDLRGASGVMSLLDSTVIEKIATYAVAPRTAMATLRPYVSANLTLFLSLTNLRGTPYSLNGRAPGSAEETTFFFGDRIRFEMLPPGGSAAVFGGPHTLDFSKPGAEGGWELLRTAAMATGAFPVFLAPRVLERSMSEYTPPMWGSVASAATGSVPPINPNFPKQTADPIRTLNVDGGVTNNDPFNYAHDYLASLAPDISESMRGTASGADRAVIGIAPFPTHEAFDAEYEPQRLAGVFSVLSKLFSALVSQSRFFGESLDKVMRGTAFDRFVIAPSDIAREDGTSHPALQCATLGAFGGFLHRGFRAHDYTLGRRNCQKFLLDSFVLPRDNPIVGEGSSEQVVERFRRPAPGTYAGDAIPATQAAAAGDWLPIIPLCSDALRTEIATPERARMTIAELDQIIDAILSRFKAVVSLLIDGIPSPWLRAFLRLGQPFIRVLARRPLRDTLIRELGGDLER